MMSCAGSARCHALAASACCMRCFGMSGPTMLPRERLGLPRSREASEFSDWLGCGGREHGWPFPPIGRCRWRGIVHTKPEAPMRRAARKLFGRPKSSKIDAHTCPEGGDARKPGPTCYATELLGSRDKESAVQKYRSMYRRRPADPPGPTKRARGPAGDMGHSPPCRWDPTSPQGTVLS
jgi:hypothetical protein